MSSQPPRIDSDFECSATYPFSPRPKSLTETVGLHYVAGLGASTLMAALVLLWHYRSSYPPTLACGGIFVVVIQWALVALPALCRIYLLDQLLVERRTRITVICGLCGGALVFGIPALLANIATGPVAFASMTLLPLRLYPVAVSFLVFRRVSRSGGESCDPIQ